MKTEFNENLINCGQCKFLAIGILRHTLQPRCKNNKLKFKQSVIVDIKKDKDLSTKSCELFERKAVAE